MTTVQTARLKRRFLEAFRHCGNVTHACRTIGMKRREDVYRWQEHDDAFAAEYRGAAIEATETLEAEAHRRAVDGLRRLKFDKDGAPLVDPETGEAYTELQYSDTLLIFLLKARSPEKYRERHDVTSGGQPLIAAHADLDAAIEQRLALMAAGGEGAYSLAPDRPPDSEDATG